ncbi:MAG: hypothetical protein R2758_16765 [Bacteroidales bacterium]
MVLSAVVTGTRIDLRWNRPVPNGSELFTVWRDTGGGSRQTAASISDTLGQTISRPSPLRYPGLKWFTALRQCLLRTAGAPVHRSSAAVVETSETIHVPNAFTPGIPGENSLFRPEFAFIPQNYDFRIWSRNGALSLQHNKPFGGVMAGIANPVAPGFTSGA